MEIFEVLSPSPALQPRRARTDDETIDCRHSKGEEKVVRTAIPPQVKKVMKTWTLTWYTRKVCTDRLGISGMSLDGRSTLLVLRMYDGRDGNYG